MIFTLKQIALLMSNGELFLSFSQQDHSPFKLLLSNSAILELLYNPGYWHSQYTIELVPFQKYEQKLEYPKGEWAALTLILQEERLSLLVNNKSLQLQNPLTSLDYFELNTKQNQDLLAYLRDVRIWSDSENAQNYHSLLFGSHFPSALLHYLKLDINEASSSTVIRDHSGQEFEIQGSKVNELIQDFQPISSFSFPSASSCLSTCTGCAAHILECKECKGELVDGICYRTQLLVEDEIIAGLTSINVLNLVKELDLIRRELQSYDHFYSFAFSDLKWTLQTNTLEHEVPISLQFAKFMVPLDFASSDNVPINLQISLPHKPFTLVRNIVFTVQTKSGVRLTASEIANGIHQSAASLQSCGCSVMSDCGFQQCECDAHFEGAKCEYLKYAKSSFSNLILQHLRWKRIILSSLQPKPELHNLAQLSSSAYYFSQSSNNLLLQLVLSLSSRNYVNDICRQSALIILSNMMIYLNQSQTHLFFDILKLVLKTHICTDSNLPFYSTDRILLQIQSLSEANTLSVPSEPKIGLFIPSSETISTLALVSYSSQIFGYQSKTKILSEPLSFFAFDNEDNQILHLEDICYVNLKYHFSDPALKLQKSQNIQQSITHNFKNQLACGIWKHEGDSFLPCELVRFYHSYVTCGCRTTGNVVLYISDNAIAQDEAREGHSRVVALLIIGLVQGVLVFLNLSFILRDQQSNQKRSQFALQLYAFINPFSKCPDLEEEEPKSPERKEIDLASNRDTLSSPNQFLEGGERTVRSSKRVVHNFRVEYSLLELRRYYFQKGSEQAHSRCKALLINFKFSLLLTNPVYNLHSNANPILPKSTQLTFLLFGISWELVLSFLFLSYNYQQYSLQWLHAAVSLCSIAVLMLPCFCIGKFLSLSKQNLRKIITQTSPKEMEQSYMKLSHRMKLIAATFLMAFISTALNALLLFQILTTDSLATSEWYKTALCILALDFLLLELTSALFLTLLRRCRCGFKLARYFESYRFYRNVIT